jgi:hypothetical protein
VELFKNSAVLDINFLDRLDVVWMWLNKESEGSEHEYVVVETRDRDDNKSRLFILDRVIHKVGVLPDPPQDEPEGLGNKKAGIVAIILQKFPWLSYLISPSRPVTPMPSLESIEEGMPRPAPNTSSSLFPPDLTFSDVHLSLPDSDTISDNVSISANNVARVLTNSINKDGERAALDRLQGENKLFSSRYAYGQNARWIKPKQLSLFELVVLAETVHEFNSAYTTLQWNCFWFGHTIFDAVVHIYGVEDSISPEDGERQHKFVSMDSALSHPGPGISGRWKGYKVSDTRVNDEELSKIDRQFRAAHRRAMDEVKKVF